MKKLKLFVWTGFSPDWTDGLAFAIAKDEASARALVCARHGYRPIGDEWGTLTVHPLGTPIAFTVSGGG